ncbi:MAG: hypothetical protein KGL56_11705 [Alphaproteobacteria bacterium]|nr:hypothetical protein [Alphaproteobacteria bacterium]
MSPKRYLAWFLSVVTLAIAALVAFNAFADYYILHDRNGPSIQTVSGFERVLKPAWIDSIEPSLVFVGSSRMREGFDPVLIDPTFHVNSFDYGVSSITAYEARRFTQDALGHPSVKTIVMALDAFTGNGEAQKIGPGFDELRLTVTADGKPTPRRPLWIFTTRYLSGGAAGMHALGLYMLLQLGPGQTASDRPDLFNAYSHMTTNIFRRDLTNRDERVLRMGPWQHQQFEATLGALCHRGDVRTILFFPPDNYAMIDRYLHNDRKDFIAFKETVLADVERHNATCEGKVALFDFLNHNAITDDVLKNGRSADYIDLIHFRPPVGMRLLRRMLGNGGKDSHLGVELTGPSTTLLSGQKPD